MSLQHNHVPYGPDRQRALNVLAQRRYRQRKRERLQSLETRLRASNITDMPASNGEIQLQYLMQPLALVPCTSGMPSNPLYDPHQGLFAGLADTSSAYLAPCEVAFDAPNLSSPHTGGQFGFSTNPTYGSSSRSATSLSNSQLSTELQDLETSQFTFPTEHAFEIPTLRTMEVSLRIAHMLGLADELLDLTFSRILDVSKIPVPLADLPKNLRPTEAQLVLPHYPVIDVLPWPSVRTRLICLFNQPDQLRPPAARGSMAIMRLMHGLDDESEGLRIALDVNGHGYDVKNWEIGQAMMKDWWWALDAEIISNSDRLRRMRGAPKLRLPGT